MKQHQILFWKRFPKSDVLNVSASLDSKPKTQSIICAENQTHVAQTKLTKKQQKKNDVRLSRFEITSSQRALDSIKRAVLGRGERGGAPSHLPTGLSHGSSVSNGGSSASWEECGNTTSWDQNCAYNETRLCCWIKSRRLLF